MRAVRACTALVIGPGVESVYSIQGVCRVTGVC